MPLRHSRTYRSQSPALAQLPARHHPPRGGPHRRALLGEGGAGLGTAFGEQKAIELPTEAGFTGITVTPATGDPLGGVFVATRPAV